MRVFHFGGKNVAFVGFVVFPSFISMQQQFQLLPMFMLNVYSKKCSIVPGAKLLR